MPGITKSFKVLTRIAGLVIVVGAIALLVHWGLEKLVNAIETQVSIDQQGRVAGMATVFLVILYALVIALPFVPGIEIGVALLMIRGAEIAPAIYLATVCGLTIAFMVGCLIPEQYLVRLFRFLHLHRAATLVSQLHTLTSEERLQFLQQTAPQRLGPMLLRYRYVVPMVLLNIPGNGVIGGGGGICMIAGLSRLYRRTPMIACVAIAVAPVPLMVWGFGMKPWL